MTYAFGEESFVLETLDESLVLGELRAHQLDRPRSVEANMAGPVDGTHATATDEPLDTVLAVENVTDRQLLLLGHERSPIKQINTFVLGASTSFEE